MLDKRTYQQNITAWPELGINFWGINKNASSTFINHFNILNGDLDPESIHLYGGQKGKFLIKDRYIDDDNAFSNGLINFAVVRNPYSRFESCYRHFKYPAHEIQERTQQKAKFNNNWNTDEFLDFIEEMFLYGKGKENKHYKRQSSFLFRHTEMDHIIKLERLKEDWPLEFPPPDFISNTSTKVKVKYKKDRVYDLYQKDFENFNYEKST